MENRFFKENKKENTERKIKTISISAFINDSLPYDKSYIKMVDRILEKPVYLDRLKKEIEESLTEERLDVSKTSQERQETITKKPVKETKTVEVPLTREEVRIERRSPQGGSETEAQSPPIQSEEEIKIPLRREEAEVTKKPYVKEEVVIKKKIVTDKKEITDEITSEELDTSNVDKE